MTIKTPLRPFGANRYKYLFTVNVAPSTATVILTVNGVSYTQKSIRVYKGTVINWSATADRYHPQSGSHTVTGNNTITVTLSAYTPSGTKIVDNSTPGSYNVTISSSQNYWVDIRGGGGGGAFGEVSWNQSPYYFSSSRTGGSGGRVYGTVWINAGTYSYYVGGGGGAYHQHTYNAGNSGSGSSGGSSGFNGSAAYGGGGAYVYLNNPWDIGGNNGGGGGTSAGSGMTGVTGGGSGGGGGASSGGNGWVYIEAR